MATMSKCVTVLVGASAVISIAGCSSQTSEPDGPGKYDQTWPQPYSNTVCADWLGEMDAHQLFVASADLLLNLRSVDGASDMVSDDMIEEFRDGMTSACVVPTLEIGEAAIGLYLTEARFQP